MTDRYKKVLTWGRGLSKIANKNAYILNALPLRKSMLLFGLQMKFLSKRNFLANFALCAVRLAVDRKEEG